ncbi:replication initiation and membrane attachment protein, DnaB/DnaD family [Lachnoanaerobaculum saburreum F0468]|uniref:Replication initiation and membrane attachment protein, DnaB/DnaD family n=1 Tax=Lachnoanaerobaculum saburreum F0468 TaxID=1095750 RepID=I0RAM7_9FIRM|nr:DnaD domain protein [Lachnoanaerobaculum saburreum]EIC96735.1 replication initiation and membrane attachment protein, DnaB/DnaD family [Lachnoanaerobaculum saburreum F0468]
MKYDFLKADITSIVSLPSEFIDKYMLKANGDYIKVYLFMLRNADRLINPEIIADALELTIKDVERAIAYWCKSGILIEKEENIAKLGNGDDFEEILLTKNLPSKEELEEARRILNAANEIYRRREITKDAEKNSEEDNTDEPDTALDETLETQTGDEVKKEENPIEEPPEPKPPKLPDRSLVDLPKLKSDEDFQELVFCVQTYTEKIFSPTDTEKLAYLYDVVGMSKDLLEYIAEISVQKGKKSISYIEKIALSFHEKGITTVEEAKEDNVKFYNENRAVLKAFGIYDRVLAPVESRFVKKWFDEYCFSPEIVVEAINRTVINTSSQSFTYADGILTRWYKENVRTLADIKALDEKHDDKVKSTNRPAGVTAASKFNNFEQRNDNIDSDMQNKFMNELNKL